MVDDKIQHAGNASMENYPSSLNNVQQVHLLCLLSLGLRQNEELNDLTLSGQLMSIMPAHLASVVNVMDSSTLERRVEAVLAWYKKTFSLEHIKLCTNIKLVFFFFLFFFFLFFYFVFKSV